MTTADELRAMLAKAHRYVASAATLRQQGDCDSAVSRLYYAMFYAAEAMLSAHGHTFSSHRAVIATFGREFVKTQMLPRELHDWLRDAFELRHIGDYEFLSTINEATVLDLEAKAQRFLETAETFLRSSTE